MRAVYEPLVELDGGALIGFEALARGPEGSELERPDRLFAAAAEALRGEWNVVVLDPHFAAAFSARDLGDDGDDHERRFGFCMTYDRELVIAAARTLMARIAAR